MKRIGKNTAFVMLAALLAAGIGLGVAGSALAVTPGLYEVEGNPNCANLYEATVLSGPTGHTGLADLGPLFGFKYDANPTGDASSTIVNNAPWVRTGTTPEDPNNSVSIFNVLLGEGEGVQFDWSATLGIDAVIVKASRAANAYVYSPEEFGDSGLYAPDNKAISHIEFCYDYELDVTKDAAGKYDRTITWDLSKSVSPDAHTGFIGDPFDSTWTVVATKSVVEDNYRVSGNITIDNPAPIAVDFSVSDVIDGSINATVSCPSYQVPANDSVTCTYSADEGDGIDGAQTSNEATVTSNTEGVAGGSDTASITFTANVIGDESVTVDDDRKPSGFPLSISDSATFTYDETFYCSTNKGDYDENGFDTTNYPNTATATGDNTNLSRSADVDVDCYIPSISKGAAGTYDERHEWDVEKTVDPASQSAFAGDTVTFDWTITVDETIFEENFDVVGTITVNNPNPEDALVVPLVDVVNGNAATIDQNSCAFDGTNLTVAAGGSETCDYTANDLPYDDVTLAPDTNTATITLNGIDFEATDPIEWAVTVIRGSATLDDDQFPYSGESVYDGWTSTYEDSYTCSSNLDDYDGGADLDNPVSNTAEVWSEDAKQDESTATTEIDCYIPSISKTAAGTYDERHEWDVEKTVTPLSQSGNPGDTLPWTWTIDVFEDVFEENFDVAGTITVNNPNSEDVLVVSLVDFVNGNAATIDQTSCNFDGTNLTVAAGGSETCDYAANDLPYTALAGAPTLNTATITLNGIDFEATDAIEWTANVIRGSATLSDDEIGLTDVPVSGGDQKTGDDSITCSSDRSAYGDTGSYGDTITNWAHLTNSDGNVYKDDATTEWLCEASFVDIYKTTNGQPADPTKDISFALYSGTTQLEIVSTLNNGADLEFQTALVPGAEYTICEYPVPAGHTFEIFVDGGNVLTYAGPPGEENPTGEIQCFDFTAADSPTTLTFEVDNRYPGGAPRTPGYWKNWNTCSGGNQDETAAKLGGVAEGVFLLNDLLPQTVGSFEITTCEVGVLVLDSRTVDSKEKNMSNDAAYELARNLLAARLNQDAGACDPDGLTWEYNGETLTFEQVLTAADNLLTDVEFEGIGGYLGPKNKKDADLRAYALYLAGIIDDYNNSKLCTGDPSH